MTSGNFIIGENLSLKGFNNCIKPNLEKYEVQITDFMSFKGLNPRNNNRILLSLIGNNESLEEIVKKSMKEAYNSVVKEEKNCGSRFSVGNNEAGKLIFPFLYLRN